LRPFATGHHICCFRVDALQAAKIQRFGQESAAAFHVFPESVERTRCLANRSPRMTFFFSLRFGDHGRTRANSKSRAILHRPPRIVRKKAKQAEREKYRMREKCSPHFSEHQK